MPHPPIRRLLILGNLAAGKTAMARRLSRALDLPIIHIDQIYRTTGLQPRPPEEVRQLIADAVSQPRWLIDGMSTFETLDPQLQAADAVVFIDLPLWRHCWWLALRQLRSVRGPRPELPPGCDEATLKWTRFLFQALLRIHQDMRPKLLALLSQPELRKKTVHVRTLADWDKTAEGRLHYG